MDLLTHLQSMDWPFILASIPARRRQYRPNSSVCPSAAQKPTPWLSKRHFAASPIDDLIDEPTQNLEERYAYRTPIYD